MAATYLALSVVDHEMRAVPCGACCILTALTVGDAVPKPPATADICFLANQDQVTVPSDSPPPTQI